MSRRSTGRSSVEPLTLAELTVGLHITVHNTIIGDEMYIVLSPPYEVADGWAESSSPRIRALDRGKCNNYWPADILAGRVSPDHTVELFLEDIGIVRYQGDSPCESFWNSHNYTTITPVTR